MIITPALVTTLLAIATIGGQIAVIALIISFGFKKQTGKLHKLISDNVLIIALFLTLGAALGSLYYSSIAHLVPCKLCWYQRIAIFPQVILLSIAVWKKDNHILDYILGLSIFGTVIAIYHNYLQFGGKDIIAPCSLQAGAVSCGEKLFAEFGFVTMPLMSLTLFLMVISVIVTHKIINKK